MLNTTETMTAQSIIETTDLTISIRFDCDFNRYYAYIFDANGDVVGETMFATSRKEARRLAERFIFTAEYVTVNNY